MLEMLKKVHLYVYSALYSHVVTKALNSTAESLY